MKLYAIVDSKGKLAEIDDGDGVIPRLCLGIRAATIALRDVYDVYGDKGFRIVRVTSLTVVDDVRQPRRKPQRYGDDDSYWRPY